LRLSGADQNQLARRYTNNTDAYQLYLKGHHCLWTREAPAAWDQAVSYFNRAVDADPGYALAHVGLSDAHSLASNGPLPPPQAQPRAERAALEALALDGGLAEAHAALAQVRFFYDWNWAAGEREIRRAIQLDPNSSNAHWLYAMYLAAMGRLPESLPEALHAQ